MHILRWRPFAVVAILAIGLAACGGEAGVDLPQNLVVPDQSDRAVLVYVYSDP
jgi:hypothetical protein